MTSTGEFSRLYQRLREKPIIGFDTEDNSKGIVTLIGFYGDFPGQKYVTRHPQEAIDFMLEDVRQPSIFVAHNLEYDIGNIFKYNDFLFIEEMVYTSKMIKAKMAKSDHEFINSSCFFPGSLAAMGKIIGIEKMEGSAFSEEYNLNDARIVYEFVKKFQTESMKENKINLGLTIGQMSMNTYRRNYMPSKVQITYNSKNCLKAYYGGRVEVFHKGAIKNITVSDINSCYPYVMREFEYPDTSKIEKSSIATHEFGIGHFEIDVPPTLTIPPLPYRSEKTGRLFFPTGNLTGWWTYAEVRNAVNHGAKIIKEYEGEGTNKTCRPFVRFITEYYDKRLLAKKKKDNFKDLFYKLWQNNLYGKFAQNKPNQIITRNKLPYEEIEPYLSHKDFSSRKVGPFYFYTLPKLEPPPTANFLWGVYVTSYARIYLYQGLSKILGAGHTVIYCDTDSIIHSGKKNPLPISSALGDWSNDEFDLGVFRMPKGYLLCDKEKNNYEIKKVACKGVPTAFAYEFIVKGIATTNKPFRLKESLIRLNAKVNEKKPNEFLTDIGVNIWRDVNKEMKSIDIKRHGEIGPTRPVDVLEIPELEKVKVVSTRADYLKLLLKQNINIKPMIKKKNNFNYQNIPEDWFKKRNKFDREKELAKLLA